jgi:hypothetical protein
MAGWVFIHPSIMPSQEDTAMENGWHDFDPIDLNTHPEDNTHVQMKYANGRQFTGIYSRTTGWFFHSGAMPEDTVSLTRKWRYMPPTLA